MCATKLDYPAAVSLISRHMKPLILAVICPLLVAVASGSGPGGSTIYAAEPGRGMKQRMHRNLRARNLVAEAQAAHAALVRAARGDAKLARKREFLAAADRLGKALVRAAGGVDQKTEDFFAGVREARAAKAQMHPALSDLKNSEIVANEQRLGRALGALQKKFSKAAVKRRKARQKANRSAGKRTDHAIQPGATSSQPSAQPATQLPEAEDDVDADPDLEEE